MATTNGAASAANGEPHVGVVTPKPSGLLAGLAATLPTLFLMVACGVFVLLVGSDVGLALEMMGHGLYLVLASVVGAWLGTTVCLFLAGRGLRVPSAIPVLIAALPWMAGVVAARLGILFAQEVIANADPSSRARMVAAGLGEVAYSRLFGATLGSGLLASVAFGLALAAIGQRAPRRSLTAPLLGLVVMLPLVGLAAHAASVTSLPGTAVLSLAGLGALFAVALGAAGIGVDLPKGRSGALAAAAPIAAALSVAAAAVAVSCSSLIEVLDALAGAPSDVYPLLAQAALELAPLGRAVDLALPLGVLAASALAGWAARRLRPSLLGLVGGVTLVLVASLPWGFDRWSEADGASALDALTRRPWHEASGFEPTVFTGEDVSFEVTRVVTQEGLVRPEGGPAPFDEGSALDGELSRALARVLELRAAASEWIAEEEVSEWIAEDAPDGAPSTRALEWPAALEERAPFALAVDRRVSGAQLRSLLEAAARARVHALSFAGEAPGGVGREEREAVRRVWPSLVPVLEAGSASARVVLEGALPEGMAASDPMLFHVRVSGAVPAEVDTREGARTTAEDRSLEDRDADRYGPPRALYVAFTDQATAEAVVQTAARAERNGFTPILVSAEVPGNPGQPFAPATEAGPSDALGRSAVDDVP